MASYLSSIHMVAVVSHYVDDVRQLQQGISAGEIGLRFKLHCGKCDPSTSPKVVSRDRFIPHENPPMSAMP